MPEPEPVEEPKAEPVAEPKEEPKEPKEAPKAKIDSQRPLSQQVNKLLDAVPETKEDPKEEPKAEEPKEEPQEEPKEPDEPDDQPSTPVELPPVAQYILDNLPQIQVIGHTEKNTTDRAFNVKRVEDLPEDFEFSSRRAELAFNAAIASQELNARELLGKYQTQQNEAKVQEFLTQQALEVQADIKDLQAKGVLPKFQYAENDPKFDSDPAVKEANEVYELFEKTNKAYADAKKSYRISYADAADKYYAAKARQPKEEPKKDEPKPNNKEREKVAAQVGAPQGAEPGKTRPMLPQGSTMRDVLRLYNQGRI